MNIEKVEKTLKKNYRSGNATDNGNSGYILSDGTIIPAGSHLRVCNDHGWKLPELVDIGICTYTSHAMDAHPVMFFKYTLLTPQQKATMRKLLMAADYMTVHLEKTVNNDSRPIRSINF